MNLPIAVARVRQSGFVMLGVFAIAFIVIGVYYFARTWAHRLTLAVFGIVSNLLLLLGLLASLALAAWTNFFYGWNFPQTAVSLLLPFCGAGYFLTLSLDKHWQPQSPLTDFKPQITVACICLMMAVISIITRINKFYINIWN